MRSILLIAYLASGLGAQTPNPQLPQLNEGSAARDVRADLEPSLTGLARHGGGRGFFLQSMNRSDDMSMFLKKGLFLKDGLKANQSYGLSPEITFASNAQTGCAGVGGAPGEGVYMKAVASLDEPVSVAGPRQHLELNVDKGQQANGGIDAGIVGVIASGEACDPENERYVRMRKAYEHGLPVSTDDRGQLWLMVGTDSAYEGLIGLSYESVAACLKEVQ